MDYNIEEHKDKIWGTHSKTILYRTDNKSRKQRYCQTIFLSNVGTHPGVSDYRQPHFCSPKKQDSARPAVNGFRHAEPSSLIFFQTVITTVSVSTKRLPCFHCWRNRELSPHRYIHLSRQPALHIPAYRLRTE